MERDGGVEAEGSVAPPSDATEILRAPHPLLLPHSPQDDNCAQPVAGVFGAAAGLLPHSPQDDRLAAGGAESTGLIPLVLHLITNAR